MRLTVFTRLVTALSIPLLLAACTVLVEPLDVSVRTPAVTVRDATILQFEPTRGANAWYRVGDQIGFRVRTTEDGYLTLTALDPTGEVYVFARNLPVRGGRTEIIQGLSPRQRFIVTAPTGPHRVGAHFTPARTDERVVFIGVRGYGAWQTQIELELRPFARGDVAETRFNVGR
jgi:hypothetical protein